MISLQATPGIQSERILGAMIFGVGGNEAIRRIPDVMYPDKPYTTLTNAPEAGALPDPGPANLAEIR